MTLSGVFDLREYVTLHLISVLNKVKLTFENIYKNKESKMRLT